MTDFRTRAERAYQRHTLRTRQRAAIARPVFPTVIVDDQPAPPQQCAECAYIDLATCRRSRHCDGPQPEGANP